MVAPVRPADQGKHHEIHAVSHYPGTVESAAPREFALPGRFLLEQAWRAEWLRLKRRAQG